jgi:hypothetical protein
MTSARYALPVALVLMLALIPTVIHSYLGLKTDDGLSVKNIKSELGNFNSAPTNRQPGWGEETFGSEDWIERAYTDEQGKSLRLFVGRSYDHKRLYHHPELALSYAKDLRSKGKIRLPGQPEIPVNLLRNDMRPNMAAFVLLYDGKFIDNPISHQIRDSLKQLISARKPMTLFYVVDDNAPKSIEFIQSPAASLLNKAIKDFMVQQHY